MKRTVVASAVVALLMVGGLLLLATLERPAPEPQRSPDVATTAAATATMATPIAVPVPPDVPADWKLVVEHRVLLALPREWGITGVPGGEADRWVILVTGGAERGDVMTVALSSGRSVAEVAGAVTEGHVVVVPPTRRELLLDGRVAQEITFPQLSFAAKGPGGTIIYEARHLVIGLDAGLVADFRIRSALMGNLPTTLTADERERQQLVAARAFALRDADISLDQTRVAQSVAKAIPLTMLDRSSSGMTGTDTTDYRIGGDERSFVIVATFASRRQRMNVDPNEGGGFGATALFLAPVTYRGVGNVFVAVMSNDVNARYRALRALDEVVPPGARLPTTCDDNDTASSFTRLLRGFGGAGYRDMFRRLTPGVTMRFEDPRGIWPSLETLRGPLFVNAFFRDPPPIERLQMDDNAVRRSGDLISTSAGATVRRPDQTVMPLFAEARVACIDGDVRFSEVHWRFG